jgi:hypothetical protein
MDSSEIGIAPLPTIIDNIKLKSFEEREISSSSKPSALCQSH